MEPHEMTAAELSAAFASREMSPVEATEPSALYAVAIVLTTVVPFIHFSAVCSFRLLKTKSRSRPSKSTSFTRFELAS